MRAIHLARKVTRRLQHLRAARPIVEAIRRRGRGHGVQEVEDFDGDLRIALDLSEHAANEIFWFGYRRHEVVRCLDRLLQPGDVVFDVGARFGEITLVAAKRVGPAGAVFALEALETTQRKLAANVAANGLDHVRRIPFAADDHPGTRAVHAAAGRYLDRTLVAAAPALMARVDLTTIDAVAAHYRLERLDGLRLDLEGAEPAALRGAAETLRRFRPWLLIETARGPGTPAPDPRALVRALTGYRLHRVEPDGRAQPLAPQEPRPGQILLATPVATA